MIFKKFLNFPKSEPRDSHKLDSYKKSVHAYCFGEWPYGAQKILRGWTFLFFSIFAKLWCKDQYAMSSELSFILKQLALDVVYLIMKWNGNCS